MLDAVQLPAASRRNPGAAGQALGPWPWVCPVTKDSRRDSSGSLDQGAYCTCVCVRCVCCVCVFVCVHVCVLCVVCVVCVCVCVCCVCVVCVCFVHARVLYVLCGVYVCTQRSPEGPRHLHRIPRLSEAPWEAP